MASESILAWHWLRDDRTLNYHHDGVFGVIVTPGQTLTVDASRLKLCRYGLHASVSPLDALGYAPGAAVCRVRCSGTIVEGDDKLAASQRAVLWMADATTLLHHYACDVAEYALHKYGGDIDLRSQAAIDVKRAWLAGDASDGDLRAATAAATRAAAWEAARSDQSRVLHERLMTLNPGEQR